MTATTPTTRTVVAERTPLSYRVLDVLVAVGRTVRLPGRVLTPAIGIAPAVLVTGVLFAGLVTLFWRSLHSFDAFLQEQGPVSLAQYHRLFAPENSLYVDVMVRTLVVALVVTLISACVALPTAHTLVRMPSDRWRGVIVLALLVPFLMGETIRAFAWLYLLGAHGVVDSVGSALGAGDPNLLGTTPAIVLGLLQMYIPLSTLVLFISLQSVPEELELAARTLGASRWRTWRHVLIPLSRPGLAAAAMVTFALATTDYATPATLGLGNLPFVANAVRSIIFVQGNQYLGAAYASVFIAAVLACLVVIAVVVRGRGRAVQA